MQVVVHLADLEKNKACPVYLDSPEWDAEQKALVYPDWDATVRRLLSTTAGTTYLEWLVRHELVPMTAEQFAEARGPKSRIMFPNQRARRHG